MTDDVFERRLRSQVGRYADAGVRPIDAYAIAVATLATTQRTGLPGRVVAWRRAQLRLTPRLALLAVLTLLAVAIAVVVVAGQRANERQKLVDQPQVTAPPVPSSRPLASVAPEAPSIARIAYVQGGDVYVAASDSGSPGRTVAVLQGQLVWLIGADGTRRSIDLGPVDRSGWRGVTWSPDGRWFAATVHSDQDGVVSHTRLYSVDGGRIAETDGGDVTWSPDGRHAAVQVSASEIDPVSTTAKRSKVKDRVVLVDRSGRLTKVANAWGPGWSPDSSRFVVFVSKVSSGDIDVLAADGSHRRTVMRGLQGAASMTWIPDR